MRFTCENTEEAIQLKTKILDHAASDIPNSFEFILPARRSPQLIYNIDGGVDEESLTRGLIEKNEGLTGLDRDGKPIHYFKVGFKIPARDEKTNHWVLSIDPKSFGELRGRGGFYFQWMKYHFAEFVNVRQCRVCGGLCNSTICLNSIVKDLSLLLEPVNWMRLSLCGVYWRKSQIFDYAAQNSGKLDASYSCNVKALQKHSSYQSI